jgi:hypothetical protein
MSGCLNTVKNFDVVQKDSAISMTQVFHCQIINSDKRGYVVLTPGTPKRFLPLIHLD